MHKRKKLIISTILIVIVSVGSYGGWLLSKANEAVAQTGVTGSIVDLLSPEALAGEETGHVNILLAGNSSDDPGHSGALLTDSIIILGIDTIHNTASIMSIPRDSWVAIPNNGYAKINAAYSLGEAQHFTEAGLSAQGGMGLLEKTIENSFGISINHSALINYQAFKEAVDLVGGIDVTIESTDTRGIFDPNIAVYDGGPLLLANGVQHLDGQTALNLARARNSPTYDGRIAYGLPGGDYDRAMYQRKMLIALANKLSTKINLTNPSEVTKLLAIFGNNTKMNFNMGNLRRLYDLSKLIKTESITQVSLTGTGGMLVGSTSASGQWILVPNSADGTYSNIATFLKTGFAPSV